MTVPRVEKTYEKHAWIILLAIGILELISTPFFLVAGVLPSPEAYQSTVGISADELAVSSPSAASLVSLAARFVGFALLGYSALLIALSAKAYRRGEKWAWYAAWISGPVVFALHIPVFLNVGMTGTIMFPVLLLIASLVALVLPIRKFFPRRRV